MTTRTPRTWAGYAGFAWSTAYLLLAHLPLLIWLDPILPYPVSPQEPMPETQQRVVEAGVCLLLIGTALTSLALVRPWGRIFPRWMLLGTAWVGAAIGVLHWVVWTAQSVLRLTGASVVPAPEGVSEPVWQAFVREYDIVNVLLYEPWFLGMGLFLGLGALQNIRLRRLGSQRLGGETPLPGWLTARGWPRYAGVLWAVVGVAAQTAWAAGATFGTTLGLPVPETHAELVHLVRPMFAAFAMVSAGAGVLCVVRARGAGLVSGILTLGGLVVVLLGIMIYDPWVFGFYGPALMGGGMLLELCRHVRTADVSRPRTPASARRQPPVPAGRTPR